MMKANAAQDKLEAEARQKKDDEEEKHKLAFR